MNILNIEHISKIFGEKQIFDDASVGVQSGDKIGIVGINGTGKSTLLRMAVGLEEPDEGQIIRQKGVKMAYMPQNPEFPEGATVSAYAFTGNPDTDWMVQSHLNELGITDYEVLISQLSGGQRRRVALAKTLSADFDFLLLDEPTNHLDEEMISWLENYLREFKGTVLMVTHDRYFMDKVTNRILEISHGKMYGYDANYSKFLELKAQREEMELASERKRQSILRMELEWAARGCRARSTKQQARLDRLEALKNAAVPVSAQTVELEAGGTRMGKKTIELHHISKQYGGKVIIKDFDYIVLKNQRLGIIGPNGCGKSTLMKLIAGLEPPDSGIVEIGETVKIGYFAQEEREMEDSKRVIDYVKDIAEYVKTADGRISASKMLERFLFTPDMQYAPIGKLSGGEKRRLYLLGVLCQEINVLLLDEPGNNLDIPTLTILEDYLSTFPGIVITVSHDRYFLDNVVDRIFAFEGDGRLKQYEGGYSDYLKAKEKRRQSGVPEGQGGKEERGVKSSRDGSGTSSAAGTNLGSTSGNSGGEKPEWKQNRPVKLKFSYKEQREFETIDEEIEALEEKAEQLEQEIMKNATNSARLSELMEEKAKTAEKLEEKMERWVYLNDLVERIAQQE